MTVGRPEFDSLKIEKISKKVLFEMPNDTITRLLRESRESKLNVYNLGIYSAGIATGYYLQSLRAGVTNSLVLGKVESMITFTKDHGVRTDLIAMRDTLNPVGTGLKLDYNTR